MFFPFSLLFSFFLIFFPFSLLPHLLLQNPSFKSNLALLFSALSHTLISHPFSYPLPSLTPLSPLFSKFILIIKPNLLKIKLSPLPPPLPSSKPKPKPKTFAFSPNPNLLFLPKTQTLAQISKSKPSPSCCCCSCYCCNLMWILLLQFATIAATKRA